MINYVATAIATSNLLRFGEGGGVGVVITFDENSKKCNFEMCVYNESHVCTGKEERDACLEMAFAMLGEDYGDVIKKDNNREY